MVNISCNDYTTLTKRRSAAPCWMSTALSPTIHSPLGFFPPLRLFSHVDDPFLDDPLPREYVLYLRPSGPLLQQLSQFWQQSRHSCGKNKAHNIFPHITLCQFFMVSADVAPAVLQMKLHPHSN